MVIIRWFAVKFQRFQYGKAAQTQYFWYTLICVASYPPNIVGYAFSVQSTVLHSLFLANKKEGVIIPNLHCINDSLVPTVSPSTLFLS